MKKKNKTLHFCKNYCISSVIIEMIILNTVIPHSIAEKRVRN